METARTLAPQTPAKRLRDRWNACADALTRLIGHTPLALVCRVAIAAIFFMSGRTKVTGFLTLTEGTHARCSARNTASRCCRRNWPPTWRPMPSTCSRCCWCWALATRLSALALLGMTLVIQTFVYPDA